MDLKGDLARNRVVFLKGGGLIPQCTLCTLSGLRQFLAIESPLNIKNAFYFTLKAFFVLKIFKFFSRLFGRVAKQLD